MSRLEALWLGIVQGLTEFFPVSSSGHLVIFRSLFGIEDEGGLLFEISVHLATLLAIAIFYRQRIFSLIVGVLTRQSEAIHFTALLAVGTLPAVVVGLSARDFIERQFANPIATGFALLATGAILWTTRGSVRRWRERGEESASLDWRIALLVGCGQALAILPGISRSGTTVAVALALGLAPRAAAEFSFLLGIIAIAGAAVLTLPELAAASPEAVVNLAYGGGAALVAGIAAIWAFVRLLEGGRFYLFAGYAWLVGGLFLAWNWAGA
ncbi:MAG: undecaprenyl-diphosphate phosphatase [Myxococcota bacterium]|jgi:undecaprenyl-diphosphatase|nr:undecaprenyl-diphosphate phosphatase [Myxococcota bacterium]